MAGVDDHVKQIVSGWVLLAESEFRSIGELQLFREKNLKGYWQLTAGNGNNGKSELQESAEEGMLAVLVVGPMGTDKSNFIYRFLGSRQSGLVSAIDLLLCSQHSL